ncbi:MAG: hypothetical protein ACC608_12820 [Anaerofustis sp.]
MENNKDQMLRALDQTIEQKCFELNKIHKERITKRLFFLGCAVFMLIPSLLAIFGVHFLGIFIAIAILLVIGVIVLLPSLTNNQSGESLHEIL